MPLQEHSYPSWICWGQEDWEPAHVAGTVGETGGNHKCPSGTANCSLWDAFGNPLKAILKCILFTMVFKGTGGSCASHHETARGQQSARAQPGRTGVEFLQAVELQVAEISLPPVRWTEHQPAKVPTALITTCRSCLALTKPLLETSKVQKKKKSGGGEQQGTKHSVLFSVFLLQSTLLSSRSSGHKMVCIFVRSIRNDVAWMETDWIEETLRHLTNGGVC